MLRRSLLVLVLSPLVMWSVPADHHEVIMVDIDGVVGRGTALHVEAALKEAEERGVPLLLRLNTPGGLVDSTLDMDLELANARVPVLTFVGPRSGFAASAGTFLFLMGQPNGMAPGTTIGSAQPITIDPSGGAEPAEDKVRNFLAGRIGEIAERTGRNGSLAERFVTENLNQDADEALATGMSDVTAADVRAFLVAIDGETARVGDRTVTLETRNARIVEYDAPFLSNLIDILGNPQIAFVLVLAGTYGVIFGLANPGSYVPETIGALVLLLGFIGIGLFSTNVAGILLLVLAVLFFVVEVFTPTHGVLTGVGVVAMLFAVVFLIDEPLLPEASLRSFVFVGYGLAAVSGAIVMAAIMVAVKSRDRPIHDALRGASGVVLDAVGGPEAPGRVEVHGEVWRAVLAGDEDGGHGSGSAARLAPGVRVHVRSHSGLTLEVVARSSADANPSTDDEAEE